MLYVLIVCALIAADQGLKYWTVTHLAVGQSTRFLPGLMRLTRLHNDGAAWSSFSGRTALLIAVTAVLLIGVFALLARRIVRHPLGVAGCLLILGGVYYLFLYDKTDGKEKRHDKDADGGK